MSNNKEFLNVYSDVMLKIKITKNKYIEFIKYKNTYNIKLNAEITEHLKKLIELWNNNRDANMEYYFNMKKHHSYINCKIEDIVLKQLWDDYIKLGLNLRTQLIVLNNLISQQ